MIHNPNNQSTTIIRYQNFTYPQINTPIINSSEHFRIKISTHQYSLPYFFILKFKECFEGRNTRKLAQKYYWVFTHPNGCPVSLKNFRFFTAANQKILPDCFILCKQTYELMFCAEIEDTSSPSESMIDEKNEDEKCEVFLHCLEELKKNFNDFHKFLMKIGFISTEDKGPRKLQMIKEIVMARVEMNEILKNQNGPISNTLGNSTQGNFLKEKADYRESKETNFSCTSERSSIENIRSKIYFERGSLSSESKRENRLNEVNNPIKKVKRILLKHKEGHEEEFCGGYFVVKSYNATMIEETKMEKKEFFEDTSDEIVEKTYPKVIAIKKLKPELQANNKYINKVQYEMSIIRQIRNKAYTCTYYEPEEGIFFETSLTEEINRMCLEEEKEDNSSEFKNCIVMDNLFVNLKEIQKRDKYLNQFQVIVQLLQAVISLHDSGIVHRDIKPGNIMFDDLGYLKLIDFSESIQTSRQFSMTNSLNNADIGLTLPYSPIECSTHCASGYSNEKIDNWSVGMVISELIMGSLPLCYSKSFSGIIKSGWSSEEFHFCYNLRINTYHDILLFPIKVLVLKMMNVNQEERLSLCEMQNLMKFYQKYFCTC